MIVGWIISEVILSISYVFVRIDLLIVNDSE